MAQDKKWGIDLTGRKMPVLSAAEAWYEPWPVDEAGKYRQPTETEIEEVYGISGEEAIESLNNSSLKTIKIQDNSKRI